MLPTITSDRLELPPGTQVQFPGTFQEYEQLIAQLGDRAAIRIRFRHDYIFLMAPLPAHGNQTDMLSDLVKALLKQAGKDWQGFNVITLKKTGVAGVEPDACFYIKNVAAILGKPRLDLERDPPPDLAIETDLTSITAIEDYVPFEVPEVWIYKSGTLKIYQFEEGGYREVDTSQCFPDSAVKETIPLYVKRAWKMGSSVALREFEQSLNE